MKRFVLHLIMLLACTLTLAFITNVNIAAIAIGIIPNILIIYIDTIAENLDKLKYWWISIKYKNTYIRLSISYLFRIKIDNKYLLVRGVRFPQFQPVGGVFKRYSSSDGFFQSVDALDDNLIPIDKSSKNDLRIRIKGKHLIKVLNWFDSGKQREASGWREFFEELIESSYLSRSNFPFIQYQYLRRHEHPIRYSDYAQSHELLIAEIYEFIPSKEQEIVLKLLSIEENNNFIWVDEDVIRRRGVIPGKNYALVISEHSQWIL